MQMKNAIIAVAAFAVGAAAGWFAAGVGRAVAPRPPQSVAVAASRAVSMKPPSAVKPKSKARAKPVPEVSAAKTAKSKPVRPEAVQSATTGDSAETPKAEAVDAEKKAKDDSPFPRYLDMFRNDPEALAAEFAKEAEKERVSLAKVREHAIEALKLNAEQVAVFEKALDDLRAEGTQITEEWVELIKSGQLNYEDGGSIFTDNRLLGQRVVAAHEKAMREMAEKLYGQLALDGVSDRDKQAWLFIAASRTVNSIECYEPFLSVYDKVYKNMGMGDGIFSWCRRQSQKK